MAGDRDELTEALLLLAHDIKNPLAAIVTNLGYVRNVVDGLANGAVPDQSELGDVHEALLDARLACDAMQRFVGNLEVIARDGAPRSIPPADPPPVDVAAIADEVADRHRASAAARRVTIEVKTEASADARWASGDRDGCLRAVDNIVANAVQHAPASTTIRVEVVCRGDEVGVLVVDQGLVVPLELRAAAVSRAGQGTSKGRPEARYGRGLALHAAGLAARVAGGRLDIGDRDGQSALAVLLPRFVE